MKTLDLERGGVDLADVIRIARTEPVLLLTADGREFLVSEADDFEREVEMLRASPSFQKFLEERSACTQHSPLEEVMKRIDAKLAAAPPPAKSRKPSAAKKSSRSKKD